MRKTFRLAAALILVLAVVMSLAPVTLAVDSTVTFLGKDEGFEFLPGSDYTDSDLFDGFKDVMPGDTLSETIKVKNESDDSDYIKLYLKAAVHDEEENPLSAGVAEAGETVATMTDFLSQLSMRVWNGSDLVYEASPDETDGLAEAVLLGIFRKGDSAALTAELKVPVDLGNDYNYRVGEVDWVFTAELFDDPTPPPTDNTVLTVRKLWVDNGENRPDSITVDLLRDGEKFAETVLSDANQWIFTWSNLEDGNEWTVKESNIPDGYSASYKTEGNITTITNTADKLPDVPVPPAGKVGLTVKKTWSGDEDTVRDRPESVQATLYNGDEAVETVILGKWNNWEYTWNDLSSDGDWKVVEVNIPKGYAPVYSVLGDVVTITNVSTLIQTGQMKWPIPVLCGIGAMFIVFGGVMISRKRKSDNV